MSGMNKSCSNSSRAFSSHRLGTSLWKRTACPMQAFRHQERNIWKLVDIFKKNFLSIQYYDNYSSIFGREAVCKGSGNRHELPALETYEEQARRVEDRTTMQTIVLRSYRTMLRNFCRRQNQPPQGPRFRKHSKRLACRFFHEKHYACSREFGGSRQE